tara:strand:- start:935 stop:1087 length:153 start_codon:yes stop_codon:yes gene_type:complete
MSAILQILIFLTFFSVLGWLLSLMPNKDLAFGLFILVVLFIGIFARGKFP